MNMVPSDPESMGIEPEDMETPEQRGKEQLTKRYLFKTVESELGKPREGEEELSLKRSQMIAGRIFEACRDGQVEIPLELLQGIDGLLAQVREKTGISVSYGVALDIFNNILAKNPLTGLNSGDEAKFIKAKFEETFGDQLDGAVETYFASACSGDLLQSATVLHTVRQFHDAKNKIIDSAVTPGNSEEEPEEASVSDISQALFEILENYSQEELKFTPILADDVLAIVAQFYDYLPQSWSDCSDNEKQIIRQLMIEAISSKEGAVLVDEESGPTITAE